MVWIIVLTYVVAAVLSFGAYAIARRGERQFNTADPAEAENQRLLKRLWLVIGVTLLVFALSRQFNLQTLLIQLARDKASSQGWYGDRRGYQIAFIILTATIGVSGTVGLGLILGRVIGRVALAVAGFGMLVSFAVIRAASFHYVDKVLSLGGMFRVNWVLEIGGIVLIIVSTITWRRAEQQLLSSALASTAATDQSAPAEPVAGRKS